MHEYTAALRVSGERLDIPNVTQALGLQPTHVVLVGEPQHRGPAKKSVWSFEVFPRAGGEWESLEDALASLMTAFTGRGSVVRQLQKEFEVYFWCGHFSSSFDGGPTLSPDLLRRLGEFGVELRIDNYFSKPNR